MITERVVVGGRSQQRDEKQKQPEEEGGADQPFRIPRPTTEPFAKVTHGSPHGFPQLRKRNANSASAGKFLSGVKKREVRDDPKGRERRPVQAMGQTTDFDDDCENRPKRQAGEHPADPPVAIDLASRGDLSHHPETAEPRK